MHRINLAILLAIATVGLGCNKPPNTKKYLLSYKVSQDCNFSSPCPGLFDTAEETAYYNTMGLDPGAYTLSKWLSDNGFPPDGSHPDAHAIYGNTRDLQIARDMNCVQNQNGNVACYVTNYGPQIYRTDLDVCDSYGSCSITSGQNPHWPDIEGGLTDAINVSPNLPFATVAMVYKPNSGLANNANNVTFYAFKSDGNLQGTVHDGGVLLSPALDGQGPKTTPRMCMACHGGYYDTSSHTVTGALFLPFDVYGFQFSSQQNYGQQEQEEGLRKLNALVKSITPASNTALINFINGTYPAGVENPGSTAVDNYLPIGWAANPLLYKSVVKPYCRTCHMAQPATLDTYQQFQGFAIENYICTSPDMPQAEVPWDGLWYDQVALADLSAYMKGQNPPVAKCPF